MESSDIEALTHRAASGDTEALGALLEAYLPSLRSFIQMRLGLTIRQEESSSDIAQSVCREILESATTFKYPSESAFKRWLFRMALRKLSRRRDFLLADKRSVDRNVAFDASGNPGAAPNGAEPDRAMLTNSTPSRAATSKEEVSRIDDAIGALDPDYREVIVLSRVSGLTRVEIAERLGRSEASVRMLLHRGLAQLAERLKSQDAD